MYKTKNMLTLLLVAAKKIKNAKIFKILQKIKFSHSKCAWKIAKKNQKIEKCKNAEFFKK